MKLNWFSPLSPAGTDIAHFTSRVLPALARLAEVTLWTDQGEWDSAVTKHASVRSFTETKEPWRQLNSSDVTIYNIGNNPLFHGSIWQIATKHSGIVILHDINLHHMFDGLYRVRWRALDQYLSEMEFYYGSDGRRDGLACYQMEARNIDEMAERYPLTQLALRNAFGAVVHTTVAYESLRGDGDLPLAYIPLPFSGVSASDSLVDGDAERRSAGPPYNLVVFGYLGTNRRIRPLLEALSAYLATGEFRLDIFGPVLENENLLRRLVRTLGLKKMVKLHGYVSEGELDRALSKADLAINLRYPTMGEASGSQLRIWSHRLPSLVSSVGWYATLPSNTVRFVHPEHEVEEIRGHLNDFLADPPAFLKMGREGRALLDREHTPELYAQGLLTFAEGALKYRAEAAFFRLAERAGVITSAWSVSPATSQNVRIAEEIYSLAGRHDD